MPLGTDALGETIMETTPHSALAPLSRSLNLRESVTEKLRTAIVTGELAEGEMVSAPALGVALGVSATPVREAMMDLTREGLVETVKNKGFRVTAMSAKELDDITEIRLLVEPPTVARVVGSVTAEGLERLGRLADECMAAAKNEDLNLYLAKDREFHATILAFADNPQLAELATSLRRRTRMYGLNTLVRENKLAESAQEHLTLLELMRAGDAAGCKALMDRHIGHARGLWARGTEEEPPDRNE
jgi:DNA-binding GntR family transcriptional regulator